MTANANSGLVNPAQAIAYLNESALDDAGYLVKAYSTAGYADLTAASADIPIGYALRSSLAPTTTMLVMLGGTGSPATGVAVAIQALIPGQEAYLHAATGGTAIAINDMLGPSTYSATVDLTAYGQVMSWGPLSGIANAMTGASSGQTRTAAVICAIALEAKTKAQVATAGCTVRVRIMSPFVVYQ